MYVLLHFRNLTHFSPMLTGLMMMRPSLLVCAALMLVLSSFPGELRVPSVSTRLKKSNT